MHRSGIRLDMSKRYQLAGAKVPVSCKAPRPHSPYSAFACRTGRKGTKRSRIKTSSPPGAIPETSKVMLAGSYRQGLF